MDKYLLLAISCFTGFFGDMSLQVLVNSGFGGKTGWGLIEYFRQHGRVESLFIPAGMMTLFYAIYLESKLPVTIGYLFIYGVLLDIFFRYTMIFPSLKGYYKSLNVVESMIWGGIPMILPLIILYGVKRL
jgi:hypothetical protein